jgi:hypothetical protein
MGVVLEDLLMEQVGGFSPSFWDDEERGFIIAEEHSADFL